MPAEVVRQAHRPFCTICGRAYGKLSVGAAGAFLKVEEAIHHIFARRWLEKRDLYPHDPENLVSICKSDHARLLQSEECLWSGDLLGFIQGMNQAGLPLELIQSAGRHYALGEVKKFFNSVAVAAVKEGGERMGEQRGIVRGRGEGREEGETVDKCGKANGLQEVPESAGVSLIKYPQALVNNERISSDAFPGKGHRMLMSKLLAQVAAQHGQTVDALREPGKSQDLVSARRHFARLARLQGSSFPVIGKYLHRHHTTIINLVRKTPWQKKNSA